MRVERSSATIQWLNRLDPKTWPGYPVIPTPDFGTARTFIKFLTGSMDATVRLRFLHDRKDKSKPAAEREGKLAELWPDVLLFQSQGYGVYYFMNAVTPGLTGFTKDNDVATIRCLGIDADNGLPDGWGLHAPAHLIVKTSVVYGIQKGQVLWRVAGCPVAQFKGLQQRLAELYGTDPSVCNPSRIFRLPGTLHLKGEPQLVTFEPGAAECQSYTVEDVAKGLPEAQSFEAIAARAARPGVKFDTPGAIDQAVAFLKSDLAKNGVPIDGQQGAVAGGNSWHRIFPVACRLKDWAISFERAVALLKAHWAPDFDVEWLEGEVAAAWKRGENEPGSDYVRPSSEALGEQAREWMKDHPEGEDPFKQKPSGRFKLRSEADQDATSAIAWLMRDVIPSEALILFYGASDTFKTFAVLDIVLSAAAARPWAQWHGDVVAADAKRPYTVDRSLTVIYAAGEAPIGLEKKRRPVWRQERRIAPEVKLPFYTIQMPLFGQVGEIEDVIAHIKAEGVTPDVIVIDTASSALGDMDEDTKGVGTFTVGCKKLRDEFHCSVIVIHHEGKDPTKKARGSSKFIADFQVRYHVRSIRDKLVLEIVNEKMNDYDRWRKPLYFQGREAALMRPDGTPATMEDGTPIASLVFDRTLPEGKGSAADTLARVTEVETVLKDTLANHRKAAVTTRELATDIVHHRSIGQAGLDNLNTLVANEIRNLNKQARGRNDRPGAKPILAHLIVPASVGGDLLWHFPAEEE